MAEVSPPLGASTCLFSVPPTIMEPFCELMDSCDGELGWRGLAERLLTDWMEFRKVERYAEQGKSRTRELLWSWAQKNKTLGDLLEALHDMGQERAIHLFSRQGLVLPSPSRPGNVPSESRNSNAKERENRAPESKKATPVPESAEMNPSPSITFQEITEGTKDFQAGLKIGDGQFFEMYKAQIRNHTFMVKLYKQDVKAGCKKQMNKFLSELEVFLLFRHSNILELVGYCSQNGCMCLIHPYMKNGSLLDRIQCSGNTAPLPWQSRLDILTGAARAVQFLHSAKPCAVLCGSLTSATILLDDQLQPKLSEFGSAHLRSPLVSKSYTIIMDPGARKSMGHLPEEYIRQGKLSTKTDVYSYAIVIMEVLTGYEAVLEDPYHVSLRDLLLDRVQKSGVDSCLPLIDQKAGNCPHSVSQRLFALAVACAASREKGRPAMEEVLEILENAQHGFNFPEDLPKSLKSLPCPSPPSITNHHTPSIPMENDENEDSLPDPPGRPAIRDQRVPNTPCECSQSEVMFLSSAMADNGESSAKPSNQGPHSLQKMPHIAPLHCPSVNHVYENSSKHASPSGPRKLVECSCSSGAHSVDCEDCIANGFRPSPFNKI
ncbi:interleukin-1 receptor-associated kinase 3 isoform X1 [Ambystoma mexicanum]|uniref:interleukin-1 receptor-associated kinase 3 isoform X1 n=1 Tax=Ambystoma mexicanum TaxID=8296 RepID=UPI0037E878D3